MTRSTDWSYAMDSPRGISKRAHWSLPKHNIEIYSKSQTPAVVKIIAALLMILAVILLYFVVRTYTHDELQSYNNQTRALILFAKSKTGKIFIILAFIQFFVVFADL